MKARTLALAASAAIVLLIAGFALYGALAVDTVEYMGLKYGPSEHAPVSEEKLYFTGEMSGGEKLYAAGWESPRKVPPLLFKKEGPGTYRAYYLTADNPPVYAYTPYARYSLREPVTIGLMNAAGGTINLSNAAPFEIQRREGGEWKMVYRPAAAQVITPVESGTYKEWAWERQRSDGAGEYRAVIDGRYEVRFTIAGEAPSVREDAADYDNATLGSAFWSTPEHEAFSKYYTSYCPDIRSDVEGLMLFKARTMGLDAGKLRTALDVAAEDSGGLEMLPCLAVHASYRGRPGWVLVYNWGMGGEGLGHIRYYVVDDSSGKIAYFTTCR